MHLDLTSKFRLKIPRIVQLSLLLLFMAALWEAGRLTGVSQGTTHPSLGFSFTNVAARAGLDALNVFGGKESNKYLLETTGCGPG